MANSVTNYSINDLTATIPKLQTRFGLNLPINRAKQVYQERHTLKNQF